MWQQKAAAKVKGQMSQLWDNKVYLDFDVHIQVNVNKYIHSKSTCLYTFKVISVYIECHESCLKHVWNKQADM